MDILRRKIRQSRAYATVRTAHLELRSHLAPIRALPDFLVIGAHKCGTSSFYENLSSHPQISPALTKEIHYFDRHAHPSERWYRAHFPTERELKRTNAICGEASPSYCLQPQVPYAVKDLIPNAKLIMLLRNPVSRAYSAYQFNSRRGGVQVSFEDWIGRDFELIGSRRVGIDDLFEWLSKDSKVDQTPIGLLRGIYVEQIRHWHNIFSRDQLTIIDSASYFANPMEILSHVATDILGLNSYKFAYQKTHHEKRNYPKMHVETKERLETFFKPYNEALYSYLGRDFGW